MWKNHLKVAFRSIKKRKAHSFINVFGLALGIASCTVIFLIVNFEWGFDIFGPDRDRIDITTWLFLMAGFLALIIAFMSVGYQSGRVAIVNPVNSLRSE